MRQSIITLIWTTCIHISHSHVQQSFQYYKLCDGLHTHALQYEFELVNVWSKSGDEEDALMKAVEKS